jgi:hypothetical protein
MQGTGFCILRCPLSPGRCPREEVKREKPREEQQEEKYSDQDPGIKKGGLRRMFLFHVDSYFPLPDPARITPTLLKRPEGCHGLFHTFVIFCGQGERNDL